MRISELILIQKCVCFFIFQPDITLAYLAYSARPWTWGLSTAWCHLVCYMNFNLQKHFTTHNTLQAMQYVHLTSSTSCGTLPYLAVHRNGHTVYINTLRSCPSYLGSLWSNLCWKQTGQTNKKPNKYQWQYQLISPPVFAATSVHNYVYIKFTVAVHFTLTVSCCYLSNKLQSTSVFG